MNTPTKQDENELTTVKYIFSLLFQEAFSVLRLIYSAIRWYFATFFKLLLIAIPSIAALTLFVNGYNAIEAHHGAKLWIESHYFPVLALMWFISGRLTARIQKKIFRAELFMSDLNALKVLALMLIMYLTANFLGI